MRRIYEQSLETSKKHNSSSAYHTMISIRMAERDIQHQARRHSAEIASSISSFIHLLSKDVLDDMITSVLQ